jgi:hypothetical protein
MEQNQWMVSLSGWLGDHAPTDRAGYLAYAKSLARPDVYDIVRHAEPLSEIVAYASPSNLRRYYERLERFPARLVVMGDALCAFNPVYGQGMSVAALEAAALETCLRDAASLDSLAQRFFAKAAKIVDTPWTIAAGSDFAYAGVTGKRPPGTAFINWYLGQVHRAASVDRTVCRAFFTVANLLADPTSLFRPAIVARVAATALTGVPGPSRQTSRTPSSTDSTSTPTHGSATVRVG